MAILLDAVPLPDDLIWSDEYKWSPVVQGIKKSLTGALIIQEGALLAGRSITLNGSHTWISKATADSIQALVDTPDIEMSLNLHGTIYPVKFARQGNNSPFVPKEIFELADPGTDHIYSFVLKLMEV